MAAKKKNTTSKALICLLLHIFLKYFVNKSVVGVAIVDCASVSFMKKITLQAG
jgi:hypothetical protein